MIPKPPECRECPMYGDGRGFVPDEMVEGAEVLVLFQNPGADEESGDKVIGYTGGKPVYADHHPAPLIGRTGYMFEKDYLPLLGKQRGEVSIANVLKCRRLVNGKRSNDMPQGKEWTAAVEHCTSAHLRVPESTRIVIAAGAHAWRACGGPGSITDWRGFLVPDNDGR